MKREKTLLLGNGINRAFGLISWDELIKKELKDSGITEEQAKKLTMPYSMQIILATNDNVQEYITQKDVSSALRGDVENSEDKMSAVQEHREMLERILNLGFDNIITTNYSYELEKAAFGITKINDCKLKNSMHHTDAVKTAEGKYMLHTYNSVTYNGKEIKIWHIHGEARKPSSIVLGYYWYCALLGKYKKELADNWHKQQKFVEDNGAPKINSWLDAFIFGDVYSLGFGCDFSEVDIWWLLNRKKREALEHGTFYFYELSPNDDFNEKYKLMEKFDIKIKNCGMTRSCDEDYKKFYSKAIDEIGEMLRADAAK